MILGLRALSLSMVSYWPWHDLSLSEEPRVCLSSTRPTRKMIFTPATGEVRQEMPSKQGDAATVSLRCCGTPGPSPASSQDMQEGGFGTCVSPDPKPTAQPPSQARGCPNPALQQVPCARHRQAAAAELLLQPQVLSMCLPRDEEEDGG